ncbi:MAG: hypothetical protein KDD11_18065 [Acidobacteria bacterium]|nr:hypothetical protein [Acidobacteriota bacterium]
MLNLHSKGFCRSDGSKLRFHAGAGMLLVACLAAMILFLLPSAAEAQETELEVHREANGWRILEVPKTATNQSSEGATSGFRGTVTFAGSGLPVANVLVVARTTGVFYSYSSTRTDSNGAYEFPFRGSFYVWVRDAGSGSYAVAQLYSMIPCIDPDLSCDVTTGNVVSVPSGTILEGIDFVVQVGGILSGRYDEVTTGFPAGGFPDFRVFDDAGNYLGSPRPSLVTVQGQPRRVELEPVPPGTYYVGAAMRGFKDVVYPAVECPNFGCDVTSGALLVVQAQSELTGLDFLVSINPADGGAISGTVTSEAKDPDFRPRINAIEPVFPAILASSFGSPGPYVIAGQIPGRIRVSAEAPGYVTEYYNNHPCHTDLAGNGSCEFPPVDSVEIRSGVITGGVDFVLRTFPIFSDGFEAGGTGAWSVTSP